jgi:3-isopropylmalate dehydrogenase
LADRSPLKRERIEGANLMIVRELTGGLYFGEPRGRSENGNCAFDTCVYSKEEITRIAEKAFCLARARKGAVTLVDKANVLATSRLWREVVTELHKNKYSDVALDYMFVDNAAMQLVTAPGKFDVLLTENLFGDILSDEASVITGSIGLLPSASVGDKVALYEPIHGSYPQAKGKNIANPVATILSAAMMLEYSFGMKQEADDIREACRKSIGNGIVSEDLANKGQKSYTTTEIGDYICSQI